MEVTSVTSKGQVTIPKELRQQLGIRQGSRIEFSLVGDHVEMRVRSSPSGEVASVMRHLLEQAHITVEDRDAIERALSNCEAGIDFADALHHASYKSCDSVATFDDRKFARRAKKLGLTPAVVIVS